MSGARRRTSLVGSLLLMIAAVIAAWPGAGPETPEPPALPVVRTDEVTESEIGRTMRLAGVARSDHEATLAFTLPGRLAATQVELGDRVSAGDVVAALDGAEYRLAENAAQSMLAELDHRLLQAERDHARAQKLKRAQAATDEELERAETTVKALQASRESARTTLEEARRKVRETRLFAPFSGTVTAVRLEPGEWAGPGSPVIDLTGENGLEVEIEAPETVLPRLAPGQTVVVDLSLSGSSTTGTITAKARGTSGPGRLFPVVVSLDPAPGLVAGTTVEVVLNLRARPGLQVPLAAVINPGSSRPAVFLVRQDRAQSVPIEVVRLEGDRVTVTGDLHRGDRVVVAGNTVLADGDAVEVLR